MKKIEYKPRNKEYFSKLLSFSKELFKIFNKLKIKPIVYGSVSYAFYTKDQNIEIHDIDLLVPESSFVKIIGEIKEDKKLCYEETNYHSLKIFKDDAKITCDSIEKYYKNLPHDFVEIKINNVPFTILSLKALTKIYKRGKAKASFKRESYSNKLEKLYLVKRQFLRYQ